MFARGKSRLAELSSVGRFFAKGSTLERATVFAESAAAYDRNTACAIAVELGAFKEHPVHEMEFFNVGGAKVSIIVLVLCMQLGIMKFANC